MDKKAAAAVSVIGGSDGPTSIFLAGGGRQKEKNPWRRFKAAQRSAAYQRRRARAEKSIRPGAHSMEELEAYMIGKYGAVEVPHDDPVYVENCKNMRAALAMHYHPELVGERPPKPDMDAIRALDESGQKEALKEYMEACMRVQERAAALSEDVMPIDYHSYEIKPAEHSRVHIELEKLHGFVSGGCSASTMRRHGGKRLMKEAKQIMADIHRYYGVTEEDIREKSERYHDLLVVLTDVM